MQDRSKVWIGLVAGLALVLLIAGCGPQMATAVPTVAEPTVAEPTVAAPEAAEPTAAEPAATEPVSAAPAPQVTAAPPFEVPEDLAATTTDSGLQYIEVEAGDGPAPQVGEVVSVNYQGTLEDGTKFDSSYDRGEPFRFPLGQGMVIPGWDEGIALMNVGGKARLIIPPDLGYGEAGAGDVIPPNSTLIFDVELLDVQPGSPASPTEVAEADYAVDEQGVKTYDIKVGDGAELEEGQQATFHYTAWLDDGSKIGSTIDFGEPATIVFGQEELVPGWQEGMVGMKVGGSRQIVIPALVANGDQGADGAIPPDMNLILEIDLLDVQ